MRAFFSACGGVAVTLALVLSCSDDSPGNADAAENCEPPLAGRILRVENVANSVSGPNINTQASCATGAMLLGGGCEVEGQNASTLVFNTNYNSQNGTYGCNWTNPMAITVETVRAWAVCLTPAP